MNNSKTAIKKHHNPLTIENVYCSCARTLDLVLHSCPNYRKKNNKIPGLVRKGSENVELVSCNIFIC